jgi:hypothetical protein
MDKLADVERRRQLLACFRHVHAVSYGVEYVVPFLISGEGLGVVFPAIGLQFSFKSLICLCTNPLIFIILVFKIYINCKFLQPF